MCKLLGDSSAVIDIRHLKTDTLAFRGLRLWEGIVHGAMSSIGILKSHLGITSRRVTTRIGFYVPTRTDTAESQTDPSPARRGIISGVLKTTKP